MRIVAVIAACVVWLVVWSSYLLKKLAAKSLVRLAGTAQVGENDQDIIRALSRASNHPPLVSLSPDGCSVNTFSVRVPSWVVLTVLPIAPVCGGYTMVVEVHSKGGIVAATKVYKAEQ